MKLKKSLFMTFAINTVILGLFKLAYSTDYENLVRRKINKTEEPGILRENDLLRRGGDGKKVRKDVELELELEAFKVASELSTSFVRKVPEQFKEIYRKSDGRAESMYKNCIYSFLLLTKKGTVSPVLYVRTLVYRLGNNYYFNLGEINDKNERENAELIRLKVGQALHLFCMKASSLYYSKDETRPLNRKIKKEMAKLEETESFEDISSYNDDDNNEERAEIREIMFYLTELLNNDVLNVEIDDNMFKKKKGIKSIFEIGTERRMDRERIKEYENMVRLVRVPLPESRLRDRYGQIHHPDAENKLGVSARVQRESDKIKSKLDQIRRDEKIIMGGHERFVDFERRKFLEAALKRNQVLSFEKNRKMISEREDKNDQSREARLKCECDNEDDCECRIVDLYGKVLGKPVSLKLEEDLFNDHQIFRKKNKNRKAEVKYFKGLIYENYNSKGNQYDLENQNSQGEFGISRRKNLYVPNSYVEIPLTGLSKLQLLTLEQLSGIDINARSSTECLPRIKEINHEKNIKVSESVPINEDSKSSTLKKSKSILSNRNRNYV
ncbi:uncharacterized protein cubi_01959 [Cryptosporidium ubiquitum]|uniref:Uncharacterized protein n=1 Tax=Cryptosporidium ubiquitum TaxID=857276 RepID=A0A1J4MML5_9CRYT|nr:uncharacterized protein cubi_01959 [Cryptosporidium ubiquitum]OII75438.1 hypothetical protein cubi_01959 [Cryptosporidium ubiquitum]